MSGRNAKRLRKLAKALTNEDPVGERIIYKKLKRSFIHLPKRDRSKLLDIYLEQVRLKQQEA